MRENYLREIKYIFTAQLLRALHCIVLLTFKRDRHAGETFLKLIWAFFHRSSHNTNVM